MFFLRKFTHIVLDLLLENCSVAKWVSKPRAWHRAFVRQDWNSKVQASTLSESWAAEAYKEKGSSSQAPPHPFLRSFFSTRRSKGHWAASWEWSRPRDSHRNTMGRVRAEAIISSLRTPKSGVSALCTLTSYKHENISGVCYDNGCSFRINFQRNI